jgi:hypothetical protein
VLFFWISIMFVFWLGTLGAKKVPVKGTVVVPGGAAAQPATGH